MKTKWISGDATNRGKVVAQRIRGMQYTPTFPAMRRQLMRRDEDALSRLSILSEMESGFQGTPLAPELVRYAAWGSMGTSS